MGAEFGQHRGRQFYGSRLAALGKLEAESGLGLLEAFDHRQLTGSKIDVAPAERAYLAAPKTAEDGEKGGISIGVPRTASMSSTVCGMS